MVYGKDIKEEIMYARLLSSYGNRMDMINIDKKYTIPRSLHDISPMIIAPLERITEEQLFDPDLLLQNLFIILDWKPYVSRNSSMLKNKPATYRK